MDEYTPVIILRQCGVTYWFSEDRDLYSEPWEHLCVDEMDDLFKLLINQDNDWRAYYARVCIEHIHPTYGYDEDDCDIFEDDSLDFY